MTNTAREASEAREAREAAEASEAAEAREAREAREASEARDAGDDRGTPRRSLPAWLLVAYVCVAAALASAAPLLVYSTSLALFGLTHVMVELRYVDARFSSRTSRELVVGASLLLGGVVLVRTLRITGVIGEPAALIEMLLVGALGALALPALWRRGAPHFFVGAVVVAALAFGGITAPSLTLVVLSVLHNLTPVGFLVDAAAPRRRFRTTAWCALAFVGAPLFVASGAPRAAWHALAGDGAAVGSWHNVAIFPTGPLSQHLTIYVPKMLVAWDGAIDAFAASVCAQLLHYGAVIVLLPRALGGNETTLAPWPPWRTFGIAVAVLSSGLVAHFAMRFTDARALYGLAAGVHAWIEVPVLLLALLGALPPVTPNATNPNATNATNATKITAATAPTPAPS